MKQHLSLQDWQQTKGTDTSCTNGSLYRIGSLQQTYSWYRGRTRPLELMECMYTLELVFLIHLDILPSTEKCKRQAQGDDQLEFSGSTSTSAEKTAKQIYLPLSSCCQQKYKNATYLEMNLETLWQDMCQKDSMFQADSLLGIPALLVALMSTDHHARAQGSLCLFSWLVGTGQGMTIEGILKPQMFTQHSYWCQQEFCKQEVTPESSKRRRAWGE